MDEKAQALLAKSGHATAAFDHVYVGFGCDSATEMTFLAPPQEITISCNKAGTCRISNITVNSR
jgi:hypothetical protein